MNKQQRHRISPVLWLAETLNERIAEEPTPLNRVLFRLAGAAYRLDYWLGLPWRCKLRHTEPVQRDYWNADACAVEESVLHCGRCDHFFGYSARDPFRRGAAR
jgi:hypothetical protein